MRLLSQLYDQAEGDLDRLQLPIRASFASRIRAYYELGKPNLSGMVVVTGVIGYYIASGTVDWWRFIHLVGGLFLTAMGACALNMVLERDIDAGMRRTRGRPIPSGRLKANEALAFSLGAFGLGFVELAVFTNLLTASLSLITLVIYAFAYTPMKKWGPVATWVGAIPGAIPPVMGWTAVRGQIDAPAVVLFGILFFWQMPHFLALAWMYREDYGRVGYRMLPGRNGRIAGIQMVVCCVALLKVSLLLTPHGSAGAIYAVGAIVAGTIFLFFSIRVARRPGQQEARSLFRVSLIYLPVLLALIVIDRAL